MAITILEYIFLSAISKRNVCPLNPSILELGEQHWHGDISIDQLKADILTELKDNPRQEELLNDLNYISEIKDKSKNFDLAKIAYKLFFNYRAIAAIDLHGTENALEFDLNEPIAIDQTFDITINCGTGEHIFNIYQFFKTIHEVTAPEGIMIHVMPFLGWIDHGFFNLQPTIYWDLAQANDYQVVGFAYQSSPTTLLEIVNPSHLFGSLQSLATQGNPVLSSNLYVAFKKSNSSQPFCIPMQGYFQVSKHSYWETIQDLSGLDTIDEQFHKELNLRELNLIVFPDWSQPEEQTFTQIGEVVKVLRTHPDCKRITLLIVFNSINDGSELCPEFILSTIAMSCLSEEEISAINENEEIEISLVEDLNDREWDNLLSQISYRVILPAENTEMISKLSSKVKFKSCHLSAVIRIK